MRRQFKILYVDFTEEKIESADFDEGLVRKFLGGPGLGAKILWDETEAKTIPLSAENRLVSAIGPFTGIAVPNSSRYSVAGLSPLTGIWGEADGGGSRGHILLRTSYLGIVIKGIANRPARQVKD